jgi:Tfp pilus assembly protein PilN
LAETDGGVDMKDINFLVSENPFEKELKKEKKSASAARVIALILAMAVGTAILLAPGIYVRVLDGRAQAVEQKLTDAKYSEVRTVKAQLANVTRRVDNKKAIINGIDADNIPASQALLIIENALPSGCYLESVNFNGNSVSIRGVAENSLIVSDFFGKMDRLKLFDGGSQGISFEETQGAVKFSVTYAAKIEGGDRK